MFLQKVFQEIRVQTGISLISINLRFYDKDNDGDFDIVPDGLATWGQHQYVNNLYWENIGGQFIKRESNY